MKKKKKATVRNPAKPKTNLFLELEGDVFIVEKDLKDKVISREAIDGKTVLQCLVVQLSQAIDNFDPKL